MLDKIFDKKKLNFWRLAFIFAGLVVIILVLLWNSPQESKAQMMDSSMGNIMKQMHVSNISIYDLLKKEDIQNQMQSEMSEMSSHHSNQASIIFKLNFLSTAMIYFLLPLIIGGSIILAIVWIK
jgi:ribonuclease D